MKCPFMTIVTEKETVDAYGRKFKTTSTEFSDCIGIKCYYCDATRPGIKVCKRCEAELQNQPKGE